MPLELVPAGNTVRVSGAGKLPLAALVVGEGLACEFWINILNLSENASLRNYITESDLHAVGRGRLHVYPHVVPSFLVFDASGFAVDWFPAPLTKGDDGTDAVGGTSFLDARRLLSLVEKRLAEYTAPTHRLHAF